MEQQETKNASDKVSIVATIGVVAGLAGGVIGSVYVAPWYERNVLHLGPGAQRGERVIVDEESAIISAVEKVNPAVVSIVISKDLPKLEEYASPFGGIFFSVPSGELEKQKIGAGSGFIISADGMIVTNKHVVADNQAEYTVITKDGQKYDAKVLATDPSNDLAIVKIEASNLPFAALGDSDHLKLGQRVIAIGNALGELQNTVTTGVISGVKRDVTASGGTIQSERLSEVIQTDAAINPGNSGGPLLNLSGEVIGVNTAVSQEAQLIGFAIPVNQLKKVVDDVKKFGHVRRPFLGVRYVIITEAYAKQNSLPVNYGVEVVPGSSPQDPAVVPGSPAAKAGIVQGDIIIELGGEKITPEKQLSEMLRDRNVGDRVTLKLLRNGQERTVTATLGEVQ